MNKLLGVTLAVMCIFASNGAMAAIEKQHWQSSDYIADSFIELATESKAARGKIQKWEKPIYFEIKHHIDDKEMNERLIKQHLQQIKNITGLKISAAGDGHAANLVVVTTTEAKLQDDITSSLGVSPTKAKDMARNRVGWASLYNKDDRIQKATVVIATDRARAHGILLSSIADLLTQVMGVTNSSASIYPSIFNPKSADKFLSGLDYLLLKLLYHPHMGAGMPANQAEQVARNIISGAQFKADIETAELAVKSEGLYPLLN